MTIIFQPYADAPSNAQERAYAGQEPVKIEEIPEYRDNGYGGMFHVTFADGFIVPAFGDELIDNETEEV